MSKSIIAGSVLLLATLSMTAAQAQGFDVRSLFGQANAGAPQAAAPQFPPASAPREWSGESGASGHPLMTADAIRAAAANFPNCVAGLWPDAERRGISRATFEQATRDLSPDLRIMDLLDQQPEFTKAFWDYLDILVTDARIQRGRELLQQYKPVFDAVEKTTGVDRHIVAAIWGVEFELQHHGGRSLRGALDRDPCVCRPAPSLFPR